MDIKVYLKFWFKGFFLKKDLVSGVCSSVFDIKFTDLKDRGIELVVFDFDDTLAEFHAVKLSENTEKLLDNIEAIGLKVAIFSNCSDARNKIIEDVFINRNYYLVNRSDKPNPAGYIEILEHFKLESTNACFVGDRLGTDVFGAYLANYKERILVKPYSSVFGGRKASMADRIIKRIELIVNI